MGTTAAAGSELSGGSASTPEISAAQEGESTAVVRLTNLILRSAVEQRAGLIEIAPGTSGGAVEFEVDAVRHHFMHMPLPAMNHVVSRIKVLGNVGFGARARSQDGSASLNVNGKAYELRITILPARVASRARIRIIDVERKPHIPDLSFTDETVARLSALLGAETGLVVIGSPVGSGSTTTFYAALRDLTRRATGIMTVEDPAESPLPGIEQTSVDRRSGATFEATLRAVLRRDPYAIGVGRADEPEALRLMAEAARDRLILTTMTADRAVETIGQFVTAGVKPEALAAVLRGVVAQRLLRRLCDACAQPAAAPLAADEIRLERTFGTPPVRRAAGCPECGGTGYRGMIPVTQALLITPALAHLIAIGGSLAQVEQHALEGGMSSLLHAARQRVAAGLTTLQEMERVLGPQRPVEVVDDQPRVLVADDDPETLLLACAILQQHGMRTVEATNGADALARIGDGSTFALLVLDLNMPVLDGREVLKRMKAAVSTAGLPVVVLTGSQNPADEVLVMEEGAADYIRKPIDPPRFLARVRAALRRQGAG
jgi:type II secretory ATPase GspE/PulE/Tfp pilus assembly ATPase PilB-like protein/ActR/RegA family two-component response regulator